MNTVVEFIKELTFWRFIVLFVLFAIIISEALILLQSFLIYGEIHQDLLIIGFFTPAIVTFVLSFITGLVLIQLRATDEKLQLTLRIFNKAHEGILITDADGLITDVNPTYSLITGYSKEEVIGKNPRLLNSGKQTIEFYADMWQSLAKHGYWQGELWNRKKNGELYAERLTLSSLQDEQGKTLNYVGLFSDITQAKEHQQTLELMAHYDVLTKLPNRALFADRFAQAIAHSKRTRTLLVVCFLHLDNFKTINDTYGHNIGDSLLVEAATRIKKNIRADDTISRQGGDEFAILLSEVHLFAEAEKLIQRIHHSLEQPYLIEDLDLTISASSGFTLYPADDADLDTLLRHADQAMYQAKLAGRNRYHYFNTQEDQQISEKHHRLQELEHALLHNQFCLYYQPKVNIKTGEVFGVEALIRWQHPHKGLIAPLDFLPVLQETKLEIQIGDWVISQALQQLSIWHKQGIHIEVSINISSYHLISPSFFTQLDNVLAQYPEIDTKYLQLEILESTALTDLNTISHIVATCQNNFGISISLDDFGTGYSSLTHLRNLTANTIKIDQSFVRDMLDDPSDYAIIDGVIGLADAFDRQIIAEGVETEAHGLMLLIMGCEQAQGYGISRPIPADNFSAWLNNYTPNAQWIAYGSTVRSLKDTKLLLLKLSLNKWIHQFETSILSDTSSEIHWPIMAQNNCHCGIWIKRSRQEKLLNTQWLNNFTLIHDTMHRKANELREIYLAGEIKKAQRELGKLSTVFKEAKTTINI